MTLEAKWTRSPLSKFISNVIDYRGKTPPSVEVGIPVISAAHVKSGKVVHCGKKFVTKETYDRWTTRGFIKPGDVLVTTEAPVGETALVPGDRTYLITRRVIAIQFDQQRAEPTFFKYVLLSDETRKRFERMSHGTTVPRLYKEDILEFEIDVPDLPTQRKIASILSAYDDLIENNTRRIAILEEMAQAIYREWFVNFRFPGHENVKLVDSPLGQIPEGWEVSPVSEVFETLGGGTPSKKVEEYWEGGDIVWFAPSDLTKSGEMYSASSGASITEAGLKRSSAKLFPAYSVMLTSRATIGVLSINTVPACTNQGFITCVPNERVSALQLFFWLREQTEKILNVATGATFKEITKGNFRKFPFLSPPPDIAEQFNSIVAPFGRNIEILIQKQKNLRTTRDLLLPKLISGKLNVEDLDIDVGMTAEALAEATV